jgi:hypothetical protein
MSDPNTNESPAQLREFAERQKAAAEQAAVELEALRAENRTNALLAAGVDTGSPLGEMFADAYKGELKVDAIKEQWLKVAPPAAPATPPVVDDGPSEAERVQAEQRNALTTGGQPPGEEPTPHPNAAAMANWNKVRNEGGSRETADREYIQTIMNAAAAGDERILS